MAYFERGMDKTDDELMAEYYSGNAEALTVLIERHLPNIFGFVVKRVGNREEAEDIVQETFLKAWKHIRTFDQGKSFKTWLFTIARNTAIEPQRKRKTLSFGKLDTDTESYESLIPDTDPLPDELFGKGAEIELLEKGLAQLSPDHREVLTLHYKEELSLTEIASLMDVSVNTVKSRDRRALKALREALAPEKGLRS